MTEARLRKVPADRVGAREFLEQGRIFMSDAGIREISNEGRQLLLHQTAICACDAVLLVSGLQVAGGDGAHMMRLEHALAELPDDVDDLLDTLDASRARRGRGFISCWAGAGGERGGGRGGDARSTRARHEVR
jgi:hypothetical protein